ncbi:MAG TPA: hypothetical protein DCR24_07370 [Bacillus bacterium]|nr:hypothetical protein [Bacillus sp. (in: firmicutes)]
MKHLRALAIKFIASLVLLYVILGLMYNMSFTNVFLISLVLGVTSYVIGDLFLLPRTNNTIATIADFGLAFMVIWIMGEGMTYGESLFTPSLIAAVGIALFEYFFHKYMANSTLKEQEGVNNRPTNYQYQTEASEELSVINPEIEKKDASEKSYQELIPASENVYIADTDKVNNEQTYQNQTQETEDLYPVRPDVRSDENSYQNRTEAAEDLYPVRPDVRSDED